MSWEFYKTLGNTLGVLDEPVMHDTNTTTVFNLTDVLDEPGKM